MKKKEKVKKVSKTSIVIAWILLIILILLALTITYLKFFIPNNNLEEHPVNDNNTTSTVITKALQSIVDNFNNSSLLADYKEQNITMTASLDNTTITINYIGDISKTYDFEFNSPLLISKVDTTNNIENNDSIFNSVFTILVYATQQRLNNTNNIDSYITGFLNESLEVEGLSKETNTSSIVYSVDVSKIIGDSSNSNESNTTENNNNNDINQNNTSDNNSIVNNDEEGE